MNRPILVIGGSARAAAMSAKRAGYESIAIDRYTDADLCRICQNFLQFHEVQELPDLANSIEPSDLVFLGPLENHPEIVEQLCKRHSLLGTSPKGLVGVRDPWQVANALDSAGLPTLELRQIDDSPTDGDWLMKPLASAGGFYVARFDRRSDDGQNNSSGTYLQQFALGPAIGAVFVGNGKQAVLVGATQQLLGSEWGGSRPFQYVGSVGVIDLLPQQESRLQQIGSTLAERFQLRGLFGIDGVVNDDGVWIVEVNPRYTASIEIVERAMNVATIRFHIDACREERLPSNIVDATDSKPRMFHAKAVVYADQPIIVAPALTEQLMGLNASNEHPTTADIPTAGMKIEKYEPITTVFANGTTIDAATRELREAIGHVKKLVADVF